jgi:hypothetical protein
MRENVESIKLQRQLKEKALELGQAQAKIAQMENVGRQCCVVCMPKPLQNMRLLKKQNDNLVAEYDACNTRLQAEQNINVQVSVRKVLCVVLLITSSSDNNTQTVLCRQVYAAFTTTKLLNVFK